MLSNGQLAILRWLPFGHICGRTRIVFGWTHLGIERNSYARFRQNSSSGFGGDVITVKIKDGCRRPYVSTDRNHFRACTTTPLGKHHRQVSKKSDQWSRRRCDEIVTGLRKGQIAILKIAAVRPYLLTDRNRFRADTFRH